MRNIRTFTVITLFVLIAAACGGNTDTVPVDVGTVETPPTAIEAEPVGTTTIAVPETSAPETPDTAQGEPVTTTTTPTEPTGSSDSTDDAQEQETETPDDPIQEETGEQAPPVTVTTISAEPETPEEPDEPEEIVYWRPGFPEEAYANVNPDVEYADRWETGGLRTLELENFGFVTLPDPYRYYVFHYYDSTENNLAEQQLRFAEVFRHAQRAFIGEHFWYPYRYDLVWAEYPNTITVTGTYPLGEQRAITVETDLSTRRKAVLEYRPLPPPIRPTTPFAEPQWPDTAKKLGRECPPVEEIWTGYGTEVTNPCTINAINQAMRLMWTGDAETRQSAIRDGHALADFFQEIDSIEDPHMKALLGEHSRANGWTYTRDVDWVGHWPGASMIHVEWNFTYPQREFTAEEYQARVRYRDAQLERGANVVDHYLDLSLGEVGWKWAKALIVRTADGTWRMSYRSICWWYEAVITIDRDKWLCPDDPNPHFPDSAWFDLDIYPPNHAYYYQDRRSTTAPEYTPNADGGAPRHNDQYQGVPPS